MIHAFRSYSGVPYFYDGWTNQLFSVDEDLYEWAATASDHDARGKILEVLGISLDFALLSPLETVWEKIDRAPGPYRIVIEASQACNLRCRYCSHTLAGSLTRERPHRNLHLEKETVDLVIRDYFDAGKATVREVFFYGGEPLLNFPVIQHAVNRIRMTGSNAVIQVVTNGVLLTDPAIVRFFVDRDVGLQVSLDGPCHDKNRRTADGQGGSLDALTESNTMAKSAKDFLAHINKDKEFAKKFFEAKTEKEKQALLNTEGYQFTQADIMKEVPLSDHVLEMAAGGKLGCDQCANGWKW
jgi:predicted ribosomally synthesized peptide with nif11-like leader